MPFPPYFVWFDGVSDGEGKVKLGYIDENQPALYFYVPDQPVKIEKIAVITTDCYRVNPHITATIWKLTLKNTGKLNLPMLVRDSDLRNKLFVELLKKDADSSTITDQPFIECATCAPDMDMNCGASGIPATVLPLNPKISGNTFVMKAILTGYPQNKQVRGNFPIYLT